MAKPSEQKSDGLEIVSIGTLYSGPLDKKYWSSSRGKDRYPYSVGYQALRTHNGIKYKMEIHEGHKGPSFMISSTDGQSCSGQTPDIAWESFQKKGCPKIKLLHGRRYSCKIDGVEIFGFRNPFVQRLLRELVANVDGTAEQSMVSSNICQGVSGRESHASSDLLPHLIRPQVKGERSRKQKSKTLDSANGARLKRQRPHVECNAEALNSRQGNQQNCNGKNSTTHIASVKDYDIPTIALVNSEIVGDRENRPFTVEEGVPWESYDHLNEEFLPQEESKKISSEKCTATRVAGNLSIDYEPLDRSKDSESKGLSSSMATADKDGEAPVQKKLQNVCDVDLYAPDTLDPMHDDTSDSAPRSHNGSPYDVKGDLISGNVVKSEGMVTETHPEELGISSASYDKSDFDSVGEDIAKSMMTVLLPRALPLLKKFSRKKKKKLMPSGTSFSSARTEVENTGADHCANVESPGGVLAETSLLRRQEKENTPILSKDLGPILPNSELTTHIVPDSFESEQCEQLTTNEPLPFSDVAEATRAPISQDPCKSDTLGRPVSVEAPAESSVTHCETSDGDKIFSNDEIHMASIERLQKGCNHIADSTLGCTSSSKKIFLETNNDMRSNPDEKAVCLETHCMESDLKGWPDFAEGASDDNLKSVASSVQISHKENIADKLGAGSTCFMEAPTVDTSEREYNGPLTESIICRNFRDGCPLNTSTITTSSLFIASEDKGKSNFLDRSLACAGKPQVSVDKEMLRSQNLVELNDSISWFQKQGTSFCDGSVEFKDGSNLKPRINMEKCDKAESIVELVGCYVHPMPVSSVLMSSSANNISLCVLCGVLLEKNRTLFIYRVPIENETQGCPSFIGHTPIMLPTTTDAFLRETALDRSGLQFTPDGQCLVLLNSIKAPSCREGKMHCPCSECTLDCFEKNAVQIVEVKLGYVTILVKLKSVDNIICILVCAPNYLIGVEESGKLHLWVMNSTWSAQIEECDLPTSECMSPGIIALKRIPHSAALVVGHNGFGEFSLWDISRRMLISSFSFPSTSVSQFLPISLFSWQRHSPVSANPDGKEHITEIMAAREISFSKRVDDHAYLPLQGDDVAIWILISTVSDSDVEHNYQSNGSNTNKPVGLWRLALLVKNVVILGSALDPSAAATGASAGHGIIGTCDGRVYMWELSTGTKLDNLHCFKGTGVSCVATDDSRSGLLAVAGGDKLLVYLHSQEAFSNQEMK